jgi:hypothetical protein
MRLLSESLREWEDASSEKCASRKARLGTALWMDWAPFLRMTISRARQAHRDVNDGLELQHNACSRDFQPTERMEFPGTRRLCKHKVVMESCSPSEFQRGSLRIRKQIGVLFTMKPCTELSGKDDTQMPYCCCRQISGCGRNNIYTFRHWK